MYHRFMALLPLLISAVLAPRGADVVEGDQRALRGSDRVYVTVVSKTLSEKWVLDFLMQKGVKAEKLPKQVRFVMENGKYVKSDMRSLVMEIRTPDWSDQEFAAWVTVAKPTLNSYGWMTEKSVWRRSSTSATKAERQIRLLQSLRQLAADWQSAHAKSRI